MLLFVTKRLAYMLIAIPIVVFFGYALFSFSTIDPVERLIDAGEFELEKSKHRSIYLKTAANNNMDLPPFYFAVDKSNYHRDFYAIIYPAEKQFFRRFLSKNYNYKEIRSLYNDLRKTRITYKDSISSTFPFLANFENLSVEKFHEDIHIFQASHPSISKHYSLSYSQLRNSQSSLFTWIPRFMWLGINNSYHTQLTEVFTANISPSLRDGRSVYKKLIHAFGLTFFMIVLSVFISLLPGIYLGKKMALFDGSTRWKWLETLLFLLRSIPLFWFLTLCLIFFTTPEYSKYLHIFPSVNAIGFSGNRGFIENIIRNGSQLLLPIIGVAIFNLGYISRQVKTLISREKSAPYILTARMKGLNNNQVQKHAFKNAFPQIITMISSGIASAIGGSVVVEFIFNIPGMGRLLLDSIRYSDFPMLITIILFLFILTTVIFTIADLLYMQSDPRLKEQYE